MSYRNKRGYSRGRAITVRKKDEIAVGSLSEVARSENISLAQAFAGAKQVVVVDDSGSMDYQDAPDPERERGLISRREASNIQLARLQEKYRGQIAVFAFSDYCLFCPDGKTPDPPMNAQTAMAAALRYIKHADGIDGLGITLISDGHPTDGDENVLEVASTFKTPIQTIYCGPHTGDDYFGYWTGRDGAEFLKRLASLTGGRFYHTEEPAIYEEEVERLLLTGGSR